MKYHVTFGKVCRYEEEEKNGITRYRPILTYKVEGKEYRINSGWKATTGRKFNFMKFKIYYDPANPSYAFAASRNQTSIFFIIVFVALFIDLFIYFLTK